MMLELFSPLFLSLFSILSVTVFLYKCWLSSKNLPPSPPRFPIIGNLHQLGQYPHISLRSLAKKYGQLMLIHFGSVPVLVVSSADAAREIMKTHDLVFSGRPKSSISSRIFYNGKDVAFAPYSEYWRQVKSISVVQLLSNRRVNSFQNVREEEVALLIENLKKYHLNVVNLSVLFGALANNIVCRIVLGKKYEGGKGNLFKEFLVEMSELLGYFCVGDYIPWLSWVDILNGLKGRAEKTAKGLDDFIEGVLKDCSNIALENGSENQYLVSVLLDVQEQNSNPGFSLDKDSVKGVIFDLFAAGTDTISTVLEWSMAELLKNPDIMRKLQNEVREIGRGKSRISEDDIENMPYLKAVIKESLRINIPIPLLVPRETREDVNVMGYDIKKGTQVLVNAWAIARDPSVWDNPEEFRPERFLNSPIDYKGLHFEFLPFGAGRRGCPGIQFGMVVNELALANVVYMFDFALPDGKRSEDLDMAAAAGLTLHKKYPLLVIATPCF